MNEYTQDIKIICQNSIIKGSIKASAGHPWRNWKIKVVAVDNNHERRGKLNYLLDHVEYMLHPTFDNPRRVFMKEPYLLQEKGWGEFDMRVVLFFANNLAEPENIFFDLHFRETTYTIMHKVHFHNPSPELIKLLSIEVPPSDNINNHSTNNSSSHDHNSLKKRRTSPSLNVNAKKIKTPPTMSSPAQFSDGPLTPSSSNYYNNKYPASPSLLHNQQEHDLYSKNIESHDLLRSIHGGYKPNKDDGAIIDDVYAEKDIDNVDPIHKKVIDENVRLAWGLPEGLDMIELARRLSTATFAQTEEIEALIRNHKREGQNVEENDEEFVVDLYSLGPDLLNQLWDYTERKMYTKPALSPFSLVQANTSMLEYD